MSVIKREMSSQTRQLMTRHRLFMEKLPRGMLSSIFMIQLMARQNLFRLLCPMPRETGAIRQPTSDRATIRLPRLTPIRLAISVTRVRHSTLTLIVRQFSFRSIMLPIMQAILSKTLQMVRRQMTQHRRLSVQPVPTLLSPSKKVTRSLARLRPTGMAIGRSNFLNKQMGTMFIPLL